MTPPEISLTACPYLGLLNDPQTRFSTVDEQHACHRAAPPQLVNLAYQGRCCMALTHRECPGYAAGWKGRLPKDARRKSGRHLAGLRAALTVLVTVLALAGLGLLALQARSVLPAPAATLTMRSRTPTATHTAFPAFTQTPSPTLTLSPSPSPVWSETPSPSPEPVGSPTPGPLAETPFGPANRFVVHVVQPGESLALLAQRYGMSLAGLVALNALPAGVLVADTPLALCPNCADEASLPRLRVVWVAQRTRADELAQRFDTPLEDLRAWNSLLTDWVEPNRWLVVKGK